MSTSGEERSSAVPGSEPGAPDPYNRWIAAYDRLEVSDRERISHRISSLSYRPLISILLPVPATASRTDVETSLVSLHRQIYPKWELIPALARAGGSDDLFSSFPPDPRLRPATEPPTPAPALAIRAALARVAGDYTAVLEPGDLLSEHALYLLVEALNGTERPDLVYSDEDEIDAKGVRANPFFKPDWSPEFLYCLDYLRRLTAWKTDLLRRLGGPRPEFGSCAEYELALRASEEIRPQKILHLPWVLYHRRCVPLAAGDFDAISTRRDAAQRALGEHLKRQGLRARILEEDGIRRVTFSLPDPPPRVSVIVPTRDRLDLLRRCVEGLLQGTDYPALELLIADNDSREPATRRYLEEISRDPRVRVLETPGRFNYSAVNNRAVAAARGPLLALLNNDVEIVDRDWLRELVGHALRPEIGAAGPLLLYPSRRIQHAGIILGMGGVAALRHRRRRDPQANSYDRAALVTRNLSAVTAASMVLRKGVFDEVGGFDEEHLEIAFNDVDLCLKIRDRGYRIVWTPHSRLIHHESESLGRHDSPERGHQFQREVRTLTERWRHHFAADPYYNPNLSLEIERDYQLASPPRRRRPWE